MRGEGLQWRAAGNTLWCPIEIHASRRALLEDYLGHRLRRLCARTAGLLPAHNVGFDDGRLILTLRSAEEVALASGRAAAPAAQSLREWRDGHLLPAMAALADCHRDNVTGFAPFVPVGGRWVPPVSWFVRAPPNGITDVQRRADLRHARRWLIAESARVPRPDDPRDARLVDSLARVLEEEDSAAFASRLQADLREMSRAQRQEPEPPSFLALLTEAELLDRLARVYRFRRLAPAELQALDLDPRGNALIELDSTWKDPHFPQLRRPTPQELWDEQIEESKTTPVFVVSLALPNALARPHGESPSARWIKVDPERPLAWVLPDEGRLPAKGYVHLFEPGDDVLMDRKRRFTAFAARHPALEAILETPPGKAPFRDNEHLRASLEERILATRGLFVVQGPPGTGKTYLATQAVRRLLSATPGARVLVCAKEHFALDNILRGITNALRKDGTDVRGFRSVSQAKRQRSPGEIDQTWLDTTVTRQLAACRWSDAAEGWSIHETSTTQRHDERLRSIAETAANVFFCTTMDGAMASFLGEESFDLVIVEEAGKCYPSELLHAVGLGRTVLLIGDHRQLPPYQERLTQDGLASWEETLAWAAAQPDRGREMEERFGDLYRSLASFARNRPPLDGEQKSWLRPFEYLFDRLSARHRLDEQFRMEAPLSRVIGTVFYGRPFHHRKVDLVASGTLPADPLAGVIPKDLDVPLLWIDTPHVTEDRRASEDPGRRGERDNAYELEVVLRYLRRLRPTRLIDMVILTPYNAQKRLLLASQELRSVCAALTDLVWEKVVRTTDEYQGREAELTILSLVRNNALQRRAWGFMTELERLNVMFSRTRFRQVVVGCGEHIERHREEADWLLQVWDQYGVEAREGRCARVIRPDEI